MKILRSLMVCCALAGATVNTSFGTQWTTSGFIFCDANQNRQIDSGDVPLPGVLIVITNLSGTYSNADFSTTPDGGFIIQLPGPDTYVEYLHPATFPADASPIIPATGTYSYTFTVGVISNFEGNFLISSTNCVNSTNPPPPPPPATNKCCMTGGGTIVKGKGQPAYTFSLEVFPGDTSSGVDNGKLDIVAHAMRLHLKGDVFEIVNCGEEGSCQFVEFQGAGTLTGIAGNKANYGVVYFYARAEDCGEGKNKNDKLYVRVYTADGNTLLLISGDANNPTNVSPILTSTGNLQFHSHCGGGGGNDNGGGKGGNGGGSGGGDQGGGNCDNGGGKGGGGDKGGDKGGKGGDCNTGSTKGGGKVKK